MIKFGSLVAWLIHCCNCVALQSVGLTGLPHCIICDAVLVPLWIECAPPAPPLQHLTQKGRQIPSFHDCTLTGYSEWKEAVITYRREMREVVEKMEKRADGVEAHNGWRFSWKVGVVQLIRADRVGDKNGFLSLSLCSQAEGQPCPIYLMERGTQPSPLWKKGWDGSTRGVLHWRWEVAMFSEWTASRAAGKRLKDVIRRQWAVPSTHNPPTWEPARLAANAPRLMLSVTRHPPDYDRNSLSYSLR